MTNYLLRSFLLLCIAGPFVATAEARIESETNLIPDSSTAPSADESKLPKEDPKPIEPPAGLLPSGLWSGGPAHFSHHVILVDKSRRTLTAWNVQGDLPKLALSLAVDLGRVAGDKTERGDLKTPEGIYFILETFTGNQIDFNEYGQRAFTLDYPNFFDQQRRKGGSGIWIHAIPDSKSMFRGSRGCVVVRNDFIEKLTPLIQIGRTPVLILDQAEYLTETDFVKQKKSVLGSLENWRKAWSEKRLDDYIAFYHSDFRNGRMKRDQWRSYKDDLKRRYQFISVRTEHPVVLQHRDNVVVQFVQHYQSDALSDVGEKTLHAFWKDSNLSILAEEWKSAPGLIATSASSVHSPTAQ